MKNSKSPKAFILSATFLIAIIFAAGAPARAEFDQSLFSDFFAKFQAANTARMAGEYDKAVASFNELLDPKYASQPSLLDMQGGVHQLLGMLYSNYLNQPDTARLHYEQAIELFLAKQPANTPEMAQMDASQEDRIASTYRMMGDFDNMIPHLLKALDYYAAYWKADVPYKMQETDFNRTVGAEYYYLGIAYKNTGLDDKAKECFTKAADMYNTVLSTPYAPDAEMLLSYIYRELGDMPKAIDFYKKSLDEKMKAPDITEQGRNMLDVSRIALVQYLYDESRPDEALEQAALTIRGAEASGWTGDLWRTWHLKGKCFEKLGKQSDAFDAYKKAIDIIEGQRSGLTGGDDRASFLEMHINVYRDMIRLLIDMGKPDDALKYLERSKARSFLDMLGGRELGARTDDEKKVLDTQLDLQKEINGLTMSLVGGGQGTRGAGQAEESGKKLRDARLRYAEIMVEVRKMNPEFSSLASVNPPDVSEVSGALAGDTTILEYYPAPDALYVWAIKSSGTAMRKTATQQKTLDGQVKILRSKITRGTLDDSYVSSSRKLYDLLVAPVEDLLPPDGANLIIVPHGNLHYLPFNALMKDEKTFLIDRFIITLSPSTSALKYILDKKAPDTGTLLALGDPLTDSLPDLPAAKDEVNAISADFANKNVYLGADASKSRLTGDAATKASVIHIASHGLFYPDKPMFSALALAKDAGSDQSGFLQVHEIFGLKLTGANLVTLSACETGLSSISGGDDLVGLSRAFIYAGSPRVIVSLWSVNDASTGELMKTMYDERKNMGTAAALRQAELKLKSNPDFSHPFFWAPFQLIGDWR